ncbi:hypothetical protein JG688_00003552, partial [Phytophthora aleatoria]
MLGYGAWSEGGLNSAATQYNDQLLLMPLRTVSVTTQFVCILTDMELVLTFLMLDGCVSATCDRGVSAVKLRIRKQ